MKGVLTKPDRLPVDDPISTWRDILEGNIFGVGHSYYVTKQPSQSFLNKVSHQEARLQESKFFESTEPWNSELFEFKDRFGTPRLQKVLSQTLTEKILARYVSRSVVDIKTSYMDPKNSFVKSISSMMYRISWTFKSL